MTEIKEIKNVNTIDTTMDDDDAMVQRMIDYGSAPAVFGQNLKTVVAKPEKSGPTPEFLARIGHIAPSQN